jgi:pyrroloquinoline quinone (PQQ) biosynthesis protein C
MGTMHEVSSHSRWIDALQGYLKPYREEACSGEWAAGVANTKLTISEMQGWILQMYPFIHAFPKFLAEALIKVEDDDSRAFFIDNIRVEKAHADHWIWMGEGFGLVRDEMIDLAGGKKPILRDVQSLTDWLWYINTKGSLAEAVAATSFAVEGITGDLARIVIDGFEAYRGHDGVDMNPKTYKWMREHVYYDEEHPKIALEVVKRYANTESLQAKAMIAAKRSIQLLHNALMTSYQAYTKNNYTGAKMDLGKRKSDRRAEQAQAAISTGFPERRFGERRGRAIRSVA